MNKEQRAELRKAAEEAKAWHEAGCPISDPYDTYPDDLYQAETTPERILQLLDYVESLERDAARLDWMIKHPDASICADGAYGPFHIWFRYSNRTTSEAKTARAAIDAAMEESK